MDGFEIAPGIVQYKIFLPRWGFEITILHTAEGPYCVIKELCGVLGIVDSYQQIEQLRERRVMQRFVKKWPVRSTRGVKDTWCIHRKAIGYWWGYISDKKVRPQVADTLVELQEDIVDASDNCLFGEIAANPLAAQLAEHSGDIADSFHFMLDLEKRVGRIESYIEIPDDTTEPE